MHHPGPLPLTFKSPKGVVGCGKGVTYLKLPWYLVGQGLLTLKQVRVDGECFYCPPLFRRKAEGHCFWFSVVRGSEFLVGTLSP